MRSACDVCANLGAEAAAGAGRAGSLTRPITTMVVSFSANGPSPLPAAEGRAGMSFRPNSGVCLVHCSMMLSGCSSQMPPRMRAAPSAKERSELPTTHTSTISATTRLLSAAVSRSGTLAAESAQAAETRSATLSTSRTVGRREWPAMAPAASDCGPERPCIRCAMASKERSR